MQGIDVAYEDLAHTLQAIKIQVEDSLPYIGKYIPRSIKTPAELFKFLKTKTTYQKDPQGIELLQTVQTLMNRGGRGDCDCFTILTLAACHYLGFSPQFIALVGKTKASPTHIYSLVYDESKKKICALDLTNPTYCMERSYNYRQILPFNMRLQLQDNYYPLASKATRKAKKETKKVKKLAKQETKKVKKLAKATKKQEKAKRKIVRAENKTARVTSRQVGHTERGDERRLKKLTGKKVKTQRKENKLIRATGRGEIIAARKAGQLDRVLQRNEQSLLPAGGGGVPGGGGGFPGESDWDDEEQESSYSPDFDTDSDQILMPEDDFYPGSEWEAGEAVDNTEDADYELMPDDYQADEIYMEDGLSGIITDVVGGIKKLVQKGQAAGQKIAGSRTGQFVQKGAVQVNEIVNLKRENKFLRDELEREKRNKMIVGFSSGAGGILAGVLIRSAFNK
jgi:hypothetical protein